MSEEFQCTGDAHLENSLNVRSSISLDREAITVSFSNLALHLIDQGNERFLTQVASVTIPIKSEVDLAITLTVAGAASLDTGVRAALVVHHVGQTSLVNLSDRFSVRQDSDLTFDINEEFTNILPAGHNCRVALFLLIERFTNDADATGFLQIDLLDIGLKKTE